MSIIHHCALQICLASPKDNSVLNSRPAYYAASPRSLEPAYQGLIISCTPDHWMVYTSSDMPGGPVSVATLGAVRLEADVHLSVDLISPAGEMTRSSNNTPGPTAAGVRSEKSCTGKPISTVRG